nr:DUF5136 domain-containing protein [Streptomyces sp. TP-A0875]
MIQLHTPKASRNQETGRLSFMRPVSPPRARSRARGGEAPGAASRAASTFSVVPAPHKIAGRALSAASVLLVALCPLALAVPAAYAAPSPTSSPATSPSASPSVTPPAAMSTVGGARLGEPGTQADLAGGAPVLPKDLSARSWIVADAESGEVLAAHNAHWRLAPASTLKMLFADTLLPRWPKTEKHTVTPSDLAGVGADSSLVGIKEDESYTVHDLWLGVFLRSGNDAVHVLSAMNGGVGNTVREMNAHAGELQALDTVVVTPDGYDAPEQVSSAYDLTLIARSGLQKKDFREYASTVRADFPGETRKDEKGKAERGSFEIQNTNRLLAGGRDVRVYPGIAGVKNGNTTNAGATFTGVAERDGRVLLVTVMHPEKDENNAVYKESARLLDWGFAALDKVRPVGELVPPRSVTASAGPSAGASSPAGEGTVGARAAAGAPAPGGGGGAGTAAAVAAGSLVVLAGGAFLVNRRWPLPDLVRRRSRP